MIGDLKQESEEPITKTDASLKLPTAVQSQLPSPALEQKVDLWLNTIDSAKAPSTATLLKRKRSLSLSATDSKVLEPGSLAQLRTSPPQSWSEEVAPELQMSAANWIQAPATPAHTISSVHDPSTPTSQSSRGRSTLSRRPEWIRDRLAQHGIVKTGRNILQQKYPEFDTSIQEILRADRHSAMKSASVRKFSSRHEFFECANEGSVLAHLIPLLIKESHLQRLSPESAEYKMLREEKEKSNEEWKDDEDTLVSHDWFDEGVTFTVNQEFRGSLLPNMYDNDDLDAKALSKGDGLSNPRPDYCWGFRPNLLDVSKPGSVRLNSNVTSLLQVVPPLESIFFLIEGKSNQGNPLQAEIQAQRGGAALVNASRKISQSLLPTDIKNNEGVDTESFVFSATLTIQCMDIYVHWAEVINPDYTSQMQDHAPASGQLASQVAPSPDKPRTIFHMTFLKSYALRDTDRLPELRHVLHNILQWGATIRLAEVKSQRIKLYDYQRQQEHASKAGNGTHAAKRQRVNEGDHVL